MTTLELDTLATKWVCLHNQIDIVEFNQYENKYIHEFCRLRDIIFLDKILDCNLRTIDDSTQILYRFAQNLPVAKSDFSESIKNFVSQCEICFNNNNASEIIAIIRPQVVFKISEYSADTIVQDKDCDNNMKHIALDELSTNSHNKVFTSDDYTQMGSPSDLIIPVGYTEIGDCAFWWNDRIKSVIIPSSTKKIGNMIFMGCSSLAKLYIPDSVTSIGCLNIAGCSKLISIDISLDSLIYDKLSCEYAKTYQKSIIEADEVKWSSFILFASILSNTLVLLLITMSHFNILNTYIIQGLAGYNITVKVIIFAIYILLFIYYWVKFWFKGKTSNFLKRIVLFSTLYYMSLKVASLNYTKSMILTTSIIDCCIFIAMCLHFLLINKIVIIPCVILYSILRILCVRELLR